MAPRLEDSIEKLNETCFCISLDDAALKQALEIELGTAGLYQLTRDRCPYLFSARPLFIGQGHLQHMKQIIASIEAVIALPQWRQQALENAPTIAQHNPQNVKGVFLGYDFHLNEQTLGLIEINTNAGGAMLNAVLAYAQLACCPEVEAALPTQKMLHTLEASLVDMFRHEWFLAGKTEPLTRIAIVDDEPQQQYLYPEFLLFQRLFQRFGIDAVIAAPQELEWHENRYCFQGQPIDLIYNRLTDFYLQQPQNADLLVAYLSNAVVLTPNPQTHALYADKRNLTLLSNADELDKLGVAHSVAEVLLNGIPRTVIVEPAQAENLWLQRRQLFFKPMTGYGGKAAYRGDKITKRVWQEVLAGRYVAQALIPPGERDMGGYTAGVKTTSKLKFDVRNYVYEGSVQWVAARLYQGQTTNFRTPGGGFAPVYSSAHD